MQTVPDVDTYIARAPLAIQSRLNDIRNLIRKCAPMAEEKISYGMPYYAYHGILVYFAYAKAHIGIYAIFEPVRALFRKELAGYEMSKGTIRFPNDEKLPLPLIKKMIQSQMKMNEKKEA